MNFYRFISGFKTHTQASDYANHLPDYSRARVAPYMINKNQHLFAVWVDRRYLEPR
jgi:hypothetical protein